MERWKDNIISNLLSPERNTIFLMVMRKCTVEAHTNEMKNEICIYWIVSDLLGVSRGQL